MAEALLQGLSITAFGMGLVFLMIIALWGVMALLVRLTTRPAKEAETPQAEDQDSPQQAERAAQAAAAAVAFALAAEKARPTQAAPVKTAKMENQWLLSGRVRQTIHTPGRGQKK
ncbi:MAG: OadG family protein [Chloroflexi bacterium]|jgi:Na+-transporting methylmalonyl-CoA/oxaloacetate decarboxylase gamma subunit|nr:OadG family protein [Anaerolineaceae bacterium]NLI44476.1 OadG family protein [Chloroflexota bacterium]HOE34853.1 OadG family protein [Anaerolineaceae bacterium]HOT25975.1 OadG family protein [Anaerolineaceae bacterium]HQK04041.1 OadG family protein [Anaerolineaceae bacterium]